MKVRYNSTFVNNDGVLAIKSNREKNESEFEAPMLFYAYDIFKEYGSELKNIPTLSNQKVNDYITLAFYKINYEFADKVTFHTGRKHFCNFCLNDLNIKIEDILTFTGHKDIKTILKHYARRSSTSSYKALSEALNSFNLDTV